jgi:hypothetical protein
VLELANAAEAVKVIDVEGAAVAYSPFFAYENPDKIGSFLKQADVADARQSYEAIPGNTGWR